MNFDLLMFFLAGVLQDFLFTLSLRFVATDKPIKASPAAFLETIVTLLVLYAILIKLDTDRSIIASVVYALGIGSGTYIAMRVNLSKK